MNFHELSHLVETSISGLKVDPVACRGEKEGQWSLRIKDATIWIDAFNFESNPDVYYFQVMSPLFKVPDILNSEIMIDLLEYAYSMYACSICKKEEWYYILHLRDAKGLDQSEVDAAIDRVGHYSSDVYSKFSFKYAAAFPPPNV